MHFLSGSCSPLALINSRQIANLPCKKPISSEVLILLSQKWPELLILHRHILVDSAMQPHNDEHHLRDNEGLYLKHPLDRTTDGNANVSGAV